MFGSFKAGELEAQWGLPLGPILLITPQPEQLETIKGILGAQKGMLPTILLFGEAYHLLPQEFWVQAAAVDGSLAEVGIVYTWPIPGKSMDEGRGLGWVWNLTVRESRQWQQRCFIMVRP